MNKSGFVAKTQSDYIVGSYIVYRKYTTLLFSKSKIALVVIIQLYILKKIMQYRLYGKRFDLRRGLALFSGLQGWVWGSRGLLW